jgi:hypothetical protein
MFEQPANHFEKGEKGLEKTIDLAIKEKLFSPATILLMISQSPKKFAWIDIYLRNPDISAVELIEAAKDLRTMGNTAEFNGFMSRVFTTIKSREDCPEEARTDILSYLSSVEEHAPGSEAEKAHLN